MCASDLEARELFRFVPVELFLRNGGCAAPPNSDSENSRTFPELLVDLSHAELEIDPHCEFDDLSGFRNEYCVEFR